MEIQAFPFLTLGAVMGYPRRAWLFLAVVVVAAVVVVGRTLATVTVPNEVLVFGLLCFLAEVAAVSTADATFSVSYVIGVASLVVIGPGPAALAVACGALDLGIRQRRDWLARGVFNAAQLSLAASTSGLTYVALGGPVGHLDTSDFPRVLIAVVASASVNFIVNCLLVATIASLVKGMSWREVWVANFHGMAGRTLAFAFLGLLLGGLYLQIGLWAVLFVLLPLMLARRVMQVTGKMNESYQAMVHGLVTAIEAKDAYTRGHAERVSELSVLVAREMGLNARRVLALRLAALMHDVGKLVVSTAILTKPGKLTDDEYEHMKGHPQHGCEVISQIDFLRTGEAIHAVRHHHERVDGRGYPDGLRGDELPLTARIVMVADAFDSMTSTRTYRMAKPVEDAIRELRRCAATQFDPVVVAALEAAVRRNGWEPTPELYVGESKADMEPQARVQLA